MLETPLVCLGLHLRRHAPRRVKHLLAGAVHTQHGGQSLRLGFLYGELEGRFKGRARSMAHLPVRNLPANLAVVLLVRVAGLEGLFAAWAGAGDLPQRAPAGLPLAGGRVPFGYLVVRRHARTDVGLGVTSWVVLRDD